MSEMKLTYTDPVCPVCGSAMTLDNENPLFIFWECGYGSQEDLVEEGHYLRFSAEGGEKYRQERWVGK